MAVLIPRTQGQTVDLQRSPNVRNTAQVDLSPISRGVTQLAGIANDYLQGEKDRADLTAVMQARRELSDWEGQTFDPSNANGISKYKGKEALNASSSLLPDLDKRVDEIRGRLTRDQQAQFDGIAGNFRDSLQGRLNGYADREYRAYESAERKATLDNLGQDAVAAGVAGDFGRQAQIANELLLIARRSYLAEGFGPEAVKASERGIVSSIHKQTVEGMMTADPYGAQSYLDRFADQLTPTDYAQLERTLYPVVADANHYNIAEQIIGGMVPAEGAGDTDIDAMIVGLESKGQNDAKNPDSSATGAGQFIAGTWLDVVKRHRPDMAKGKSDEQILALRTDGELSREMVTRYREDNARQLQARGVALTPVNLYAAHHFGAGGAVKFAQASGDTPMASILPKRDIAANKYLQGKTKAEVLANWAGRGLAVPAMGAVDGAPIQDSASVSPPATFQEAVLRIPRSLAPRDRRGVEAYLRDLYAAKKAQQEAADQAASMSIYDKVTAADPTQPLSKILTPAELALAGRESSLAESINRYRKLQSEGAVIEDDPVTLDQIHRLQATDPTKFAALNLAEYGDKLSGKTMKTLAEAQRTANDPAKRADWLTDEQRVNVGLAMLGLDSARDSRGSGSGKKNEPRDRMRGEFRIAYNNALQAFTQNTTKKPTPEQADTLMRTVALQFAKRMEAGTTAAYSSGAGYQLQIGEADRERVRAAYRAKYGQNPSDAWVTQYITSKRGATSE